MTHGSRSSSLSLLISTLSFCFFTKSVAALGTYTVAPSTSSEPSVSPSISVAPTISRGTKEPSVIPSTSSEPSVSPSISTAPSVMPTLSIPALAQMVMQISNVEVLTPNLENAIEIGIISAYAPVDVQEITLEVLVSPSRALQKEMHRELEDTGLEILVKFLLPLENEAALSSDKLDAVTERVTEECQIIGLNVVISVNILPTSPSHTPSYSLELSNMPSLEGGSKKTKGKAMKASKVPKTNKVSKMPKAS